MPKVTREALTRKVVDAAKATGKAYRLRDATVPGLVLRVSAAGTKSWAMVWGRGQEKAFANYPATTLEGAREAAASPQRSTSTAPRRPWSRPRASSRWPMPAATT